MLLFILFFLALGKTQLANYDNIFILVLSVHHFWGESSKVLFRCLFFVTYIRFLLLILGFCYVYQVFVTYIRFLLRISGFCYVYQVFVTYIRTDHMLWNFLFQLSGGLTTPYPGFATPATSGDLDLNKIGEARKSLVGVKLDQVCIFSQFG